MKQQRSSLTVLLATSVLSVAVVVALAENIVTGFQFAFGENVGWLNAEPGGDGGPGVEVTDTELSGYLWGENIGWVSLSCLNTASCGGVDYRVTNDGAGNLAGYAWSENIGWISFSCTNTGSCATVDYGVTIDPATGEFGGRAWGENIGWVSFASAGPAPFAVETSWRGAVADTTAPVIAALVVGTLGNNDWYVSDVTLQWSVQDPESAVSSSTGCGPTTVSSDTVGVTFTCSATSAGGTASQSVTIMRDATPPTLSGGTSPAANGAGWNNTDVTVSFVCSDATSGVAVGPVSPQVINTEGTGLSASATCIDNAGHGANTSVTGINIDKTTPVITITTPVANFNLLQNEQVASDYSCDASISGVQELSGSVDSGQNVDTSSLGPQTFQVICADKAGNTASETHTFTVISVSDGIGKVIDLLEGLNVAQGIENSLDSKLQNARDALGASNAGQRQDVVNKLNAVISAIEAQRDKKLTSEQADQLIAEIRRILALL